MASALPPVKTPVTAADQVELDRGTGSGKKVSVAEPASFFTVVIRSGREEGESARFDGELNKESMESRGRLGKPYVGRIAEDVSS